MSSLSELILPQSFHLGVAKGTSLGACFRSLQSHGSSSRIGACSSMKDKAARPSEWATRVTPDCHFGTQKTVPVEHVTTSSSSAEGIWSKSFSPLNIFRLIAPGSWGKAARDPPEQPVHASLTK
eukprot:3917471-Amphidinium_carterae.1